MSNNFGYRASIDYIHRLVTETPFSKQYELEESTPEWVHFRDQLPRRDRFLHCTQRVIGNAIWRAKKRNLCLYCWMPNPCCSCKVYRTVVAAGNNKEEKETFYNEHSDVKKDLHWINVPSTFNNQNNNNKNNLIKPVFILHPDEFLSPTNSGHIAAISLDAPLVIWGMPGFEEIMQQINHLYVEEYPVFLEKAIKNQKEQNRGTLVNDGDDDDEKKENKSNVTITINEFSTAVSVGESTEFLNEKVLKNRPENIKNEKPKVSILYPEVGCEIMEDYIHREVLSTAATVAGKSNATTEENDSTKNVKNQNDDNDERQEQQQQIAATSNTSSSPNQFILLLLDATWPQAHRLNRHLPRNDAVNAPPRVSLVIDNDVFGKGLFGPLRKRTRETGCSTLEATALALSQLILSFGPSNSTLHTKLSESVSSTMIWDMALFVDLVVTLKHLPTKAEHDFQEGEIAEVVKEICKALPAYIASRREEALSKKPEPVPVEKLVAEGLLAAPVARYCYVCLSYVGVNRMEEHCRGDTHRDLFYARMEEIKKEHNSEKKELTREELLGLVWYPRECTKENVAWTAEMFQEREERIKREEQEKQEKRMKRREEQKALAAAATAEANSKKK